MDQHLITFESSSKLWFWHILNVENKWGEEVSMGTPGLVVSSCPQRGWYYACYGEPCRVNSNERQHRMVGSREQLYFIFSGQLWVLWVMIQYDILICIMLWPQMTLDSAGGLWGKITAIRTDYIEPLGVSILSRLPLVIKDSNGHLPI